MRYRRAVWLSSSPVRFVLAAWVAALTLLAAPATALADGRYYNSADTIQTSHPDWMKWVRDDIRLSELSIPGTHQSVGEQHGFTTDFVLTQGLSVASQLNAGVRALHVRFEREDNGSLTLVDDFTFAWDEDLAQVLATVDAFLTAHPTEAVLVWVQGGRNDGAATDTILNAARQFLANLGPSRALASFESNPTMAAMRGRVLLLNDHTSPDFIQDVPEVNTIFDVESKWDRVRSHLGKTATGGVDDIYVNFLSGEDDGALAALICFGLIAETLAFAKDPFSLGVLAAVYSVTCGVSAGTYAYPYAVAGGSALVQGVNDYALDYLLESRTLRRTGILMMDFPGAALIDAIIAHNFRFALNVPAVANDFAYMFNNIAYNGTEIGGDQQALDRLAFLYGFANFVFQDAQGAPSSPLGIIDVVVWGNDARLGGRIDHRGLYRQTDFIDTDNIFETRTYSAIGFNVNGFYRLPPAVRTALPNWVNTKCPTLSGTLSTQANTLHTDLVAAFPGVQWNAVVKDGVGGFDNWAYRVGGDRHDTGGGGHRCVVWGYAELPPPPPPPENNPPTFVSFEPLLTNLAKITYRLTTSDPDNDPVTVDALDLPDWLGLYPDDEPGVYILFHGFDCYNDGDGVCIAQNPPAGNYPIQFDLSDGKALLTRTYTVKVNGQPSFTSGAHLTNVDNTWSVNATDVNEDPVTMVASSLPNGLLFEDKTGGRAQLSISPTHPPAPGEYEVIIEASDGSTAPRIASGEVAGPTRQTFTLTVASAATDTVAPVILASAKTSDGTPYAAGAWTSQTVTVQFGCFDAGVGVETCPDDVILGTEGVTQSVSGTATDFDGNFATTSFGPVRIDKTPPTIAVSATSGPIPYVPGTWATQPVTVTFACVDALSGVNVDTVTPPITLGAGVNQSVVGACSDYAGNSANAGVGEINIDSDTDADGVLDRVDNAPNHFNPDQRDTDHDSIADVVDDCPNDATNTCDPSGSAAVYLDAAEGGALTTPDGSVSVVIPPDAAAASASVSITDLADGAGRFALTTSNQGNVLGVLAVDLQPSQTFKTPVIITFTWPDENNDGIVDGTDVMEGRLIVTKDNEVVTDLCGNAPVDDALLGCDQAANTFRFAVTSWSTFVLGVHDDDTAPEIVASATNADGSTYVAGTWTRQPVTVHFECADPGGSGVRSCPADEVVDAEGVTASVLYTATDRAGNSTSASVGQVKIDRTGPTLVPVVSPSPVVLNGTATATAGAADALSGLDSSGCEALVTTSVGTKSVTCTATDLAGNTTAVMAEYKVIYRFDGFLQPINDTAHAQLCGSPCPMSTFKGGSTVPVKFQLKDATGAVVQSSGAVTWLTPVDGGPSTAASEEVSYGDPATVGGVYLWDGQQYHYNWGTKGFTAGHVWRIGVTLVDGETYFVRVGLR